MKNNKNKLIMLIVAICAMTSTAWALGDGNCNLVYTYKCDGCKASVLPTEIDVVNKHCFKLLPLPQWISDTHLYPMSTTCSKYPQCKEDNK